MYIWCSRSLSLNTASRKRCNCKLRDKFQNLISCFSSRYMPVTNCTIGEKVSLDTNPSAPGSKWIITSNYEGTISPECNATLALNIEEDSTVVLANSSNATKFIIGLALPLASLI